MSKQKYAYLLASLFSAPLSLLAQTPTASFATWKDNKKAAYTIIHDDYGDVTTPGIQNFADTIAYNRGVKIDFGAITSVVDAAGWTAGKRMITHGHEVINHSHSHLCAVSADPDISSWCTPTYTDFATELGLSTTLIETNTGSRPRFFIHPYDVSNESIHAYLKNIGYLGARAGSQAATNAATFSDYFHLNYFVYEPGFTLAQLNVGMQAAIAAGGYAIQELHGVQDDSWGMVTTANYRSHLNLVKDKMNSGELWASTLGEVITYRMQRGAYTPAPVYNAAAKTVTVNFTPVAGQTVNTAILKSPVTINVGLTGITYTGALTVTQAGAVIPATDIKVTATGLTVNAYPYKGALVITGNFGGVCTVNCPPPPCIVDGKTTSDVFLRLTMKKFNLTDLTTDPRYPSKPTRTEVMSNISGFQRGDLGNNYGERVHGYLVPKTTGAYTFTITGDDDTELWLSTDNNPATKRKIAGFTGYTTTTQFTKYPGQKSATITLTAGKSYYLEVLHVGITGVDMFKIYWQTPTKPAISVITSDVLSSKPCATAVEEPVAAAAIRDIFSFEGAKEGNKAQLNWVNNAASQTADYFVVEKLLASGEFGALDHVRADMKAGETRSFSFTDEKTTSGENYYRIKLVGKNGTRYSEIVKVAFDDSNWKVYPNPARNYVELDLKSRANQAGRVEVYDAFGRVVVSQVIDKITDAPYRLELDGNLATGQHWVRVHVDGVRDLVSPLMITK